LTKLEGHKPLQEFIAASKKFQYRGFIRNKERNEKYKHEQTDYNRFWFLSLDLGETTPF
jgi:hypothetical protein